MKRLLIAGLAVSAFTIGAASAADLPHKGAPLAPPPYVPNWSGCYIGGNGGGAWSRSDYTFNNGASTIEPFNFNNESSWIAGGQVGCQYQTPNSPFVLGLEGTWSGTDLHHTDSSTILFNIGGPFQRSLKIDEIATVVAKVGYAGWIWPNTLWYGKIGGNWGHAKFNSNDLIGITSSASGWGAGVTAGGGVEFKIWNNFVAGVEFDFYNFTKDNVVTGTVPAGFLVSYNNTNVNIYAVTGRLSYLFNWGP
jgi:outer membrane immunogenic protein